MHQKKITLTFVRQQTEYISNLHYMYNSLRITTSVKSLLICQVEVKGESDHFLFLFFSFSIQPDRCAGHIMLPYVRRNGF